MMYDFFMALKIAVAGASGYAGGELLRLALSHPEFEIGALCASSSAGQALALHHPHLAPLAARVLQDTTVENLFDHDVIFLALPHGASGEITAALLEAGYQGLLVDCGADHRLVDPEDWRQYYGSEAAEPWTYGMPELIHAGEVCPQRQRQLLSQTRKIAVPGCNATAVTLALLPAIASGLIGATGLVATLAVGYSGAGKALKPHLSAAVALGNAQGYSLGGVHRHIPEMAQNLKVAGAGQVTLSFSPILVPMARGILANVTVPLADREVAHKVMHNYQACYGQEALIEILPAGTWPTTQAVAGSGLAHIGLAFDEKAGQLLIQCALDNLGKGTAAAAIQSANLALGLPELLGVPRCGGAP